MNNNDVQHCYRLQDAMNLGSYRHREQILDHLIVQQLQDKVSVAILAAGSLKTGPNCPEQQMHFD
jgi:hypothetical protein